MKIGIMGSHGVGKSTLARELAESMGVGWEGRVALIGGTARACPWPVNQAGTVEAQQWIYHTQMIRELEVAAEYDAIVCDRTVLDGLAYAEWHGFSELVSAYIEPAVEWVRWSYMLLYFMRPVAGRLVDDGFRDTDPAFQADIDRILGEWVRAYKLPAMEVAEGNGKIESPAEAQRRGEKTKNK